MTYQMGDLSGTVRVATQQKKAPPECANTRGAGTYQSRPGGTVMERTLPASPAASEVLAAIAAKMEREGQENKDPGLIAAARFAFTILFSDDAKGVGYATGHALRWLRNEGGPDPMEGA